MKNTTKLKQILIKYDILFTMQEGEYFKIVLIDKTNNHQQIIEEESYTAILRKAHSYMLKNL